ncbi:lipase secretion chaperone [Leptospira vanthielii]|uniref:Lipase helper protein n=1 Tax=Leptospira vanthielii serovar Holland str. Waz Holland = ATCC 700522 TaxID=1218591 RepID=N1VZ41_9LEPT|nr:lipase secretion chaperone [Leptospira vanthielii]EMY69244.1 proteobacterial lipase chaperone protein [Leptospira vanthielii serovar Holland str. Waz Holland = ATCC 700522]
MDFKKIIIIVVIFLIFFLGLLYFLKQDSTANQSKQSLSPEEQMTMERISPLGTGEGFWDEAISPFREDKTKPYLELLDDLKTGKINFVWEVWALRRKCKAEYTPDQCNATILAYIDAEYESPDKEKVKDLFISYFRYEEEYRKWEQPTDLSFVELYEKIKAKRRDVLNDKADLIFGMEESQVSFLEGTQNFIKQSANLPAEQRVKQFEDLKKKTYGTYYDSLVSREDKFDHYQVEMSLRDKEFNAITDPKEKEKYLNRIEIKYFGKERAGSLAEERSKESKFKESISKYELKEKDFLRENANLSAAEKEKKLKELRIQFLGSEEEADAYIRRKNIEEAGK